MRLTARLKSAEQHGFLLVVDSWDRNFYAVLPHSLAAERELPRAPGVVIADGVKTGVLVIFRGRIEDG